MGAFLLTLTALPIARHATAGFAELSQPFAGWLQAWTEASWLARNRDLQRRLATMEQEFEETSPIREIAGPLLQGLLSRWGGVGHENVYLGLSGWLLLRDGVDYLFGKPFLDPAVLERRRRAAPTAEEPPAPDPRPALIAFQRDLAARGIRLLLLPAPTKPMLHPEALERSWSEPEGDWPLLHNPSFLKLREDVEQQGLSVFDPLGTLARQRRTTGEPMYLQTDSHWSPQAVDAIARELAARIRLLAIAFDGEPRSWGRESAEIRGRGDLWKSLQSPWLATAYPEETVRLERVVDALGDPWRSDPRAEILLLGDSFSNVFSQPELGWGTAAGLAEQLAFHLQRPIDRLAINGGGSSAARQRLAHLVSSGSGRLDGKKLVIYEIAVRDLAVGDWPIIPLELPALR